VATDKSGAIPRFHLGFESAAENLGAGPLVISGHRDSEGQPEMVADQAIQQSDGTTRTVPDVGRLRYVYSADHDHWHLLGFDHYELRRAGNYKLFAPDQKTGFCLGDRYNTDTTTQLPGEPAQPFYTGYCGRTQTQLLSLVEGISVGYGDVYFANLEGQFVDVTGVPASQYYLIHRVNADRKLVESDYTNDAASLLIQLSWPGGTSAAPSVEILRGCPAADSCPGPNQQPPILSRRVAQRYAPKGFQSVLGFKPSGFKVACNRVRGKYSRACSLRGVHHGRRYDVSEVLRYSRWKNADLYVVYSLRGKTGRLFVGKSPPPATASAAVAEPSKRVVAFHDPLLDGVRVGPVVHEVPRLVRDPLRGLRRRAAAQ
jgi:hypothetical protein